MLEAAWLFLFLILFAFIYSTYNSILKKKGSDKTARIKKLVSFTTVSLLWFIYVYLISQSDILLDRSFPPRFPILLIMPLFLFTGIFLYKKRNSHTLHAIPRHLPIAFQSFRAVIEVLFYFTFLRGLFPEVATFAGYNFDFIIGLSAPVVAYIASKITDPTKLLVAWNIVGLAFLANAVFIVFTSFYFPEVWGSSEPLLPFEFLKYPFVLLPAFFMPSAVFMHVLSLVQLRKN